MFNQNKNEDVYTPQREDNNKDRKRIALYIGLALLVMFIGWQILKPNDVPGGTTIVRVDKSGQTPGVPLYTPSEEERIREQVLEAHGPIPGRRDDAYGNGVEDSINSAIEYVFYNLVREDNPNIRRVNPERVMERMSQETDRWQGTYVSPLIAYELMQLFNFTSDETLSEQELAQISREGVAVANPSESYGLVGDGIQTQDITPDDSPFYVMNVSVTYRSETSVPVRIEFNATLSNNATIFHIEPIGIETVTTEE